MKKTINLDVLPNEIWNMILLRTNLPTFLSFIQTCQRVTNLADEIFWKYKYQLDFGRPILPLMTERPNVTEAIAKMKLINTEKPRVYKRNTGVSFFGPKYEKFLKDFPKNWKPETWKERYRRTVLSKRYSHQIVMTSQCCGYLDSNGIINLHDYRKINKIGSLPRVISLSLGGDNNYTVTEDGQCYICRSDSIFGTFDSTRYGENLGGPKLIPGLYGIIKIVGGVSSITGFMTDDYSIYLANYEHYSMLHKEIHLIPPVKLPIKGIDFDVGWNVTGVIGIDKNVYLCVPNSIKIVINLPESIKLVKIKWKCTHLMDLYQVVFPPIHDNSLKERDLNLKFKQVIIGNSEIVILSSDGDIYRIKYNNEIIRKILPNGRPAHFLNCDNIVSLGQIRKVEFETDIKFTKISGNLGNYSALSNDRNVYVWGDSLDLIFDLTELDGSPTEICPNKKSLDISIWETDDTFDSPDHSSDFDDDEIKIFCPIQKPNLTIFDQPTRVKSISNLFIKSISINTTYLAILTENEELIVKGEITSVVHHSADYDCDISLFGDRWVS